MRKPDSAAQPPRRWYLHRHYLGDGVYAHFDEHGQLWITTSEGAEDTNKICVEGAVLVELLDYLQANNIIEWKRKS